ncbi:hypothetical protein ARMSODRAFT_948189 [Armillaria solidipes]|uniref:Uncharacterized protein n=1 Tax=Armillaria solidipes TaxID=1076256 RepID=A0A2H3CI07_9AGAR|nr:hypothetical protein ARMSODRAFT_948189 [Armillaria solidipes]
MGHANSASKVIPLDYYGCGETRPRRHRRHTHVIGQTSTSAFLRSTSSIVQLKTREALASTFMTRRQLVLFHHGIYS